MSIKSGMVGMMMGVGATLMYQSIKDGSMQKMLKKITRKDIEFMKDLEDMM